MVKISTRCHIGIHKSKFEGVIPKPDVLLYRHSDGYPGKLPDESGKGRMGVVPDILPFLKEFIVKRGYEVEYMGACLIAYLKQFHCGDAYTGDNFGMTINGINIGVLGHGISTEFHGDIEYYYAIVPDKLKVYRWNGQFNSDFIEEYSLTSEWSWEKK